MVFIMALFILKGQESKSKKNDASPSGTFYPTGKLTSSRKI